MSLYNELSALLTAHPLLWLSESECPVEPVRLTTDSLTGYTVQGSGYRRLCQMTLNCDSETDRPTWRTLQKIMTGCGAIEMKKPTGNPSEYHLLIIAYNPHQYRWQGIQTKLIQS